MSLVRLFHTLRVLRPVQIWGRPWHWLHRRFWSIGYPAALPRAARACRQALLGTVRPEFGWRFIGRSLTTPVHSIPWDPDRARRLVPAGLADRPAAGGTHAVGPGANPLQDKLWRYSLNYFDFLFPPGRFTGAEEAFLIVDWLAANDDEHAEPWEPYVVSRRIRNWVRWRNCPNRGRAADRGLAGLIDAAVYYHLKRLWLDLEHHLQANHLLENYAALVVGTCHLLSVGGATTAWGRTPGPSDLPADPRSSGEAGFPAGGPLPSPARPSALAPTATRPAATTSAGQLARSRDGVAGSPESGGICGKVFDNRQPRRPDRLVAWLEEAAAGLLGQVAEQVLPDGGHYERSPMYHLDMLTTLRQVQATVLATRQAQVPGGVLPVLDRVQAALLPVIGDMQDWLDLLTHPDGGFAQFHDSALPEPAFAPMSAPHPDPRPEPVPLPESSPSLPRGHPPSPGPISFPCDRWLRESGYVVRRWETGNYLAIDVGIPSPPHQCGHSHGSALSYELSVAGRRVVVDTGVGSYHDPAVRQACRGTAAHNVPLVEGTDQGEFWGGFRLGRRWRIVAVDHDPVRHRVAATLRDWLGNRYRRTVTTGEHRLEVEDTLEAAVSRGAFLSLLHLHPAVALTRTGPQTARLAAGPLELQFSATVPWEARGTRVYPTFGDGCPATAIRCQGTHHEVIRYAITWNP
ncbi:MAG: hypothetical protein GX442_20995 [Candidatus Riflebacteria bacterium]|nr:hypothetical protein [Candidatus Riflebacteria bacterium]